MSPDRPISTGRLSLPGGLHLSLRANVQLPLAPQSSVDTQTAARPRVVLLHGFPEAAFVWDTVLQRLEGRVDAVAPNLRGFADSSSPTEVEAYHPRHLVADLIRLIESVGAPLDLLVAHDWGGALAWSLAARRPDLLKRLLIVNAPHPATFLRELLHNPAQQAASAYMNFLCRPDAQDLLAQDDFRRLWPFFTRMGAESGAQPGAGWLTPQRRQAYREVWSRGLTGAVNYYRASPLRPPLGPDCPIHRVHLSARDARVTVPTTVLWGMADPALPPALLRGLDAWVPDLRVLPVPEATHWIVHERPDLIVQVILESLPETQSPPV